MVRAMRLIRLNDTSGPEEERNVGEEVYDALFPMWNKDIERLIVTYTVGERTVMDTDGCDVRLIGYDHDNIVFAKAIEGLVPFRWPTVRVDVRRVRDVRVIPDGGTAIFVMKNGVRCDADGTRRWNGCWGRDEEKEEG